MQRYSKNSEGAEMILEIFSQRYERSATMVTRSAFNKWTEILGSKRLTGAFRKLGETRG